MGRFPARIDGADRGARRLLEGARTLREEMRRAVGALAEDAELIFAAHALRRSGRLARGMSSRVSGTVALVRADARNPESGYDYVGVTRFGHRVRRIYPRRARALRIPLPDGRVIFRRSVRGFRPRGDWAQRALPDIHREAERAARRLGIRLEARL